MIDETLLSEYFTLSKERKEEVMEVVCEMVEEAYLTIKYSMGEKHALRVLQLTFDKEMEECLNNENYEYCEIIKQLKKYINNAITKS